MASVPHVQIMSRPGCCLCDEVAQVVAEAASHRLCTWEKVDIDRDAALLQRYGVDIPVVLIDGETCFRHRLDAGELAEMLALKHREKEMAA